MQIHRVKGCRFIGLMRVADSGFIIHQCKVSDLGYRESARFRNKGLGLQPRVQDKVKTDQKQRLSASRV